MVRKACLLVASGLKGDFTQPRTTPVYKLAKMTEDLIPETAVFLLRPIVGFADGAASAGAGLD